jgi:hypothetical protein
MNPRIQKLSLCGLLVAGLGLASPARAQLSAGDIAIVGCNADRDDFAWVALRSIPSNTLIAFTDSSVSNGCFRWTEHLGDLWPGPLTWSCTNRLPSGTVVRWTVTGVTNWSVGQWAGGKPRFSSEGDQIIVYTGTIVSNAALAYPWRGDPAGAHMLYALNFANSGWDNVTGGEATTSFVPPGLSTGACTAVHMGSRPDGYYHGPRAGTWLSLLRALADPVNWTTGSAPYDQTNWPAQFEVQAEGAVFSVF